MFLPRTEAGTPSQTALNPAAFRHRAGDLREDIGSGIRSSEQNMVGEKQQREIGIINTGINMYRSNGRIHALQYRGCIMYYKITKRAMVNGSGGRQTDDRIWTKRLGAYDKDNGRI